MRWIFLFLLISSAPASAEDKVAPPPLSKEDEARKAAEVLGETYQAPKADQSEVIIDFAATEGMNDEEKDVVLANYERTKGEYKEDMSDSLFEKISKAYVRNLDRILVKKKID